MKNTWKLKELGEFVDSLEMEDDFLSDLVTSISRSFTLFSYHIYEARNSMGEFHDKGDPVGHKQVELILGDSKESNELQLSQLKNEAHSISAIYSIRSIYDQLAQLLNRLLLDDHFDIGRCDISKVKDKLPDSSIKTQLSELLSSNKFKYLQAFVNTVKHRNLVKQNIHIDFEEDRAGVKFKGFTYCNESYSEKWSDDLLKDIVDVKNVVIKIGQALNNAILPESV